MAQFEAGHSPADHTVREVVDFLKGEDVTPDEYDRVMQAERERDGGGRVGILNLSGEESAPVAGADVVEDPAGPNEAATGQVSPADRAKTVSDPKASGDAGVTAAEYPEDAPASLGPDMPQSQAEEDAHAQTIAAQATQTPEQARALAAELSAKWRTAGRSVDGE
jgi:hypothetical protein